MINMSYDIAKFWIDLFQSAILIAVTVTYFFSQKQAATVSAIEDLEDQVADKMEQQATKVSDALENMSIRLARLEQDMQHSPTHNDLGKIHEKLNAMRDTQNEHSKELTKAIAEMSGELKHLARSVECLRDNELNCKNRSV